MRWILSAWIFRPLSSRKHRDAHPEVVSLPQRPNVPSPSVIRDSLLSAPRGHRRRRAWSHPDTSTAGAIPFHLRKLHCDHRVERGRLIHSAAILGLAPCWKPLTSASHYLASALTQASSQQLRKAGLSISFRLQHSTPYPFWTPPSSNGSLTGTFSLAQPSSCSPTPSASGFEGNGQIPKPSCLNRLSTPPNSSATLK